MTAMGQQQPASSLSPEWLLSSAYRPLIRINHERRLTPEAVGHESGSSSQFLRSNSRLRTQKYINQIKDTPTKPYKPHTPNKNKTTM